MKNYKIKTSINFLAITLLTLIGNTSILSSEIKTNCIYKNKKLYGRIQFVDTFPDIRIRIVTSKPNLRVVKKQSNAIQCGEWQIVNFAPSIRIMIDQKHGEIDVQYVDFSPGVPK